MLWHRTAAIAAKEFAQVRRDHAMLRIIVVMPLMLLILFGYAINTTVKDIGLAVYDQSRDRVSAAMLQAFEAEHRFAVLEADSEGAMREAVRAGHARAALHIPPGALAKARAEEAIPFTVYVDGSDPSVAAQVRAGVATASQDLIEQIMAGRALANPGLAAPLSPTFETLYNPRDRTTVYMVPGIIGIILTQVTILLTAIAIVRERETGTMEGLIATPVRPVEVVLGKTLPYLLIGLIDAAIIVGVGVWHFEVPFVGNVWLLVAAILLFVLGSLGLGILISTLASRQIHAMLGTMAYLLPSIFLSGLLFPVEGFNDFFDGLSHIVPLRYFLQIARGVMLRGAGLESLWGQFAALGIFAAAVLGLASLRFKKTL